MDDTFDYCREIETYLCKKNEGHLVRIVGPAFEQVRGWAEQGIPLKVAFRGIDRTCERHDAKGGRRRPLRIEFCEADVLEAFDAWRRAIGTADRVSESAPSRKEPLAAHIERAVSRLLALRTNGNDPAFAAAIASTVEALDELVKTARQARGEARAQIIDRLAHLDASLVAAATRHLQPAAADALRREADAELAPFAARMTDDARERAAAVTFERLLRENFRLPELRYD